MSAQIPEGEWIDLGPEEDFRRSALREVQVGRLRLAISFQDGAFGAISGACNHVGGPLGEGRLVGDYVECPWHYWKFHRVSGEGEPGYESDCVPRHEVEVREGRLWVRRAASSPRRKSPHPPHRLARPPRREPLSNESPLRVLGISTTSLDPKRPRYSTSQALLETALEHARAKGARTELLRLSELSVRPCEGFYSRSARACTWPCSITQMDPTDEMERVYELLVHWADVVLVATPIRWGSASALYFKMIERMNCIQNQITLQNRVLIRNKVASFVITGGQDNVQAVAGQMLGFFAELGFVFPPFPYIAHSRGWSAEDMERNVAAVRSSTELAQGVRELVARAMTTAEVFLQHALSTPSIERGGRKAHRSREPVESGEAVAEPASGPE